MSEPNLDRSPGMHTQVSPTLGQPIGRILIDTGAMSSATLVQALAESHRARATLDRVAVAQSFASPQDVLQAQCLHHGAMLMDRAKTPPDASLASLLAAEFCLKHGVLPWMRIGETLVIATARPQAFDAVRARLPTSLGPVMMAIALEQDIHAEIGAQHGAALGRQAETWVRAEESCRDINRPTRRNLVLGGAFAAGCFAALALYPTMFFAAVVALAVLALICSQLLKGAALLASRTPRPLPTGTDPGGGPTPMVSLLVPLFHEATIVETLVKRLERLSYPKSQLEVILALEREDHQTREVLDKATLPPWMRVVDVPKGTITTKPRALNYALRFCKGEIIGIYDAEDAPAPDQIDQVTRHFGRAPPQVACIQGILDFYNPRANWLARCFTVEYATWFRLVLPGVARLGFAVPLGGTSVFFRRRALDHVRGWDAHNVTEDADLGIRLARYGYRTELLPSVTREEANNRAWPWVRQRSRWLKGYMLTYLVHMRRPTQLWHDLGAWKFLGFQLLFLTTILQFILAPALWSFWMVVLGYTHPLTDLLGAATISALTATFLLSEAFSLGVNIAALSRSPHRGLLIWVPTLQIYFMLGVVAAYKALFEAAIRPFHWEKTAHGHSQPDTADRAPPSPD